MQDRDVTAQIWAKKRATQIEEIFFSLRGIMNLPPRHPCFVAQMPHWQLGTKVTQVLNVGKHHILEQISRRVPRLCVGPEIF